MLSLAETVTISSPLMWAGFIVFVLIATAIDLNLGKRSITTRAAVTWTVVWVVMALGFGAGLWHYFGRVPAEAFLAGYLLEKSLSVDNLFVFVLVFAFFRTPRELQHRALVWGIIGAMVMRAVMIISGAALIQKFEWVEAIFGLFLVYTGIKMLSHDEEADPSDSFFVRFLQRRLPLVDGYRDEHFMVREVDPKTGKMRTLFTRLFLVLLVIEASDVIFAVDSVPAIFGVTKDPFIVFTSNIFAILGLRALYFAIASAIQRLQYLNYGLSLVLAFIGVKMLLPWIPPMLSFVGIETGLDPKNMHVPTWASLLTISTVITITVVISLMMPVPPAEDDVAVSAVNGEAAAPAVADTGGDPPADAGTGDEPAVVEAGGDPPVGEAPREEPPGGGEEGRAE